MTIRTLKLRRLRKYLIASTVEYLKCINGLYTQCLHTFLAFHHTYNIEEAFIRAIQVESGFKKSVLLTFQNGCLFFP